VSFPCWVVPDNQAELLKIAGRKKNKNQKWIAKPWSSGGGNGISVLDGLEGLETLVRGRKKLVVQPFLADPLLVNGKKVDMRVYVLVTSTRPLRAWVHERGLVRFASQLYQNMTDTAVGTGKTTQFLTNTSLNKKESNATAAELTWSFHGLFHEIGTDRSRKLRMGMDRSIALLLLSVEEKFHSLGGGCDRADGACYHLLGFDIILPAALDSVPKIIEVNGEPSFARATSGEGGGGVAQQHYDETKALVARDVAQMLFSPITDQSKYEARQLIGMYGAIKEKDDQLFVEYAIELTREQQVNAQFRPCYPSPLAAVYSKQNELFEKVLSTSWRLRVHHVLTNWERKRVKECVIEMDSRNCREGGRASVMSDILNEPDF